MSRSVLCRDIAAGPQLAHHEAGRQYHQKTGKQPAEEQRVRRQGQLGTDDGTDDRSGTDLNRRTPIDPTVPNVRIRGDSRRGGDHCQRRPLGDRLLEPNDDGQHGDEDHSTANSERAGQHAGDQPDDNEDDGDAHGNASRTAARSISVAKIQVNHVLGIRSRYRAANRTPMAAPMRR